MSYKVQKSEAEWRAELTPEQYHITREKGTERAFSGALNYNKEKGIYTCVGCGAELFSSEQKYDSGSGWPSFWAPLNKENIGQESDRSWFMVRTEVHCSNCGRIWAIYLTTARGRPASATALTRLRSTSSRATSSRARPGRLT
jgi:peptide-methionine (R)-S-oxide reductase